MEEIAKDAAIKKREQTGLRRSKTKRKVAGEIRGKATKVKEKSSVTSREREIEREKLAVCRLRETCIYMYT